MKVVLRVLLVVVIALVILAVGAYFYLDTLARNAITYSATRATGVKTTLDSAHVGVFAGELTLDDLAVHNPKGFKADRFLSLDKGEVRVTLSSLMDNTVVIPKLHLDGLALDLEYANGKANYQVILDNLKKLSSGPSQPNPKGGGGGKGFKINDARITGVRVHVHLVPPAGVAKTVDQTLKVGDIDLGQIGTNTSKGVVLSRVTAIILRAVIDKVVNDAGSKLPGQILTGLKSGLGDLGDLRQGAKKALKNAAGEAAKQGLHNLLGGKKDKDQKGQGKSDDQ